MLRWLCLAVLTAMLGACGSVPPINFSVENVSASPAKIDAEVKSITVTVANANEATGKIDPGTSSVTQLWKTSIEESLDRMAVFRDDAPRKVSLAVKILRLELTGGPTGIVDTSARYQLIDRASGAILFSIDINTRGEAMMGEAIMALARYRDALNRSVQANIQQFLQALPTAKFARS